MRGGSGGLLRRGRRRALQRRLKPAVNAAHLLAGHSGHPTDHNAHQKDDERVLDQPLAFFAVSSHLTSPSSLTRCQSLLRFFQSWLDLQGLLENRNGCVTLSELIVTPTQAVVNIAFPGGDGRRFVEEG